MKKKKQTKIIWGVLIIGLLIGGYFLFIKPEKSTNLIEIDSMYDSNHQLIQNGLSVVGGVEGVKYITFKITVNNKDTVDLNFNVVNITPDATPSARPTNVLNVAKGQTGFWTTGQIDVEPYEGTTKNFCTTVISNKIPALRESSLASGCVAVKIDPNPAGTFDISLVSNIGTGGVNPGCTESWTCGNWGACSSGTQTRTCTDSNNCGTTTNRPSTSQSCSSQLVKFRTNDGTYASGSWIAYDADLNGALNCFVYSSSTSLSSAKKTVILTDLFGKEWSYSSPNMQLYTGLSLGSYRYQNFVPGTGCELSSSAVSTYIGKEMYA